MAIVALMLFAGHCVYASGAVPAIKSTKSLQLSHEAVTTAPVICGEMVTIKKA
jgi:hypothetical protein